MRYFAHIFRTVLWVPHQLYLFGSSYISKSLNFFKFGWKTNHEMLSKMLCFNVLIICLGSKSSIFTGFECFLLFKSWKMTELTWNLNCRHNLIFLITFEWNFLKRIDVTSQRRQSSPFSEIFGYESCGMLRMTWIFNSWQFSISLYGPFTLRSKPPFILVFVHKALITLSKWHIQ